MKELFLKLSTLNGSLNGNRYLFAAGEAPKGPEQQVEAPKDESKKAPESSDQAIRDIKEEEMTFMDKVRLKSGMTTEARLPLEKQMDSSANKQEALNSIASQLLAEAKAEGAQKNRTYVNFAEKYGVNNPLAQNAAQITYSALSKLVDDPAMIQIALEKAKSGKTEKPAKAPELVATLDNLEKQMDSAPDAEKQATLDKIAIQLLKEADAEGSQKDRTFANFADKYRVNNPLARNAAQITYSALSKLVDDPAMIQKSLDLAKREVYKAKEVAPLKPAKQPEMVAQVAKKAPAKAPKLASVTKVAPKPKEITPNQEDIKELADKVQKELPKDLARALIAQIDKINKANPNDISIVEGKVDNLLANFRADKDPKKTRNEIARLGIDVGYAITERNREQGGEVAKK